MFEDRDLKLDLAALGLLAVTLFLTASVLSYHPADAPSHLVFPTAEQAHNLCGRIGAVVAWSALEGLGLGAYYLIVSAVALAAVMLARHEVDRPVARLAGWLASLAGLTGLATMIAGNLSPGPVIGAGGYLGAAVAGTLQMYLAWFGGLIACFSLLIAGLLLCTEYALVRLLAVTLGRPTARAVRTVSPPVARAMMRLIRRAEHAGDEDWDAQTDEEAEWDSAEDDEYVDEADDEEPAEEDEADDSSIRIVRPRGEEADADAEEAEEADEDADNAVEEEPTEEDAEGEPASATGSARESLRKMLGIRGPAKPAASGKAGKKAKEHADVLADLEAAQFEEDDVTDYEMPSTELLLPGEEFCFEEHERDVRRKAKLLEKTFANFGFNVRVVEIQTGPVIAQFEVELEAGLRLAKITNLADDLAIALRVPSVRIVAPIPGKNTVGIEVPNKERQIVRLREVIEEANGKAEKMRIPIYLGKDVSGNPMLVDLSTLPHLLIAGRTGTGKSVCLNSIIVSMLMTRRPDEVRMLLIDPKMVELSPYKQIPHLMHPVVTDMRKAEAILAWAVEKMEERYQLLARAGVRHISAYNQLGEEELMERMQPEDDQERQSIPLHIPYVVIVADEMADLMMTAAKEVEGHIIRLAQKSRAVGIHLVLATQKPTVDVITGLIKSNLPARIAFQVASRTDSRVVLDEMGADKLLGNGDLLFLWPGTSTLIRGQGTYVSDDEISGVIGSVATSEPQFVKELVQLKPGQPDEQGAKPGLSSKDDLYESAIEVIVREGRGSVSLLQRALGIGYGRGARLIDYMAEDGIVGPYNGSQAREVLISLDDWQAMQSGEAPSGGGVGKPGASPGPAREVSGSAGAAGSSMPVEVPAPVPGRAEAPSRPQPSARRNRNKIRIADPSPDPLEAEWEEAQQDDDGDQDAALAGQAAGKEDLAPWEDDDAASDELDSAELTADKEPEEDEDWEEDDTEEWVDDEEPEAEYSEEDEYEEDEEELPSDEEEDDEYEDEYEDEWEDDDEGEVAADDEEYEYEYEDEDDPADEEEDEYEYDEADGELDDDAEDDDAEDDDEYEYVYEEDEEGVEEEGVDDEDAAATAEDDEEGGWTSRSA